ncbi:hypothetical protein COMA2_50103 [Candidatus Nitrospira nitrificans]|uniref:Uncharacterized protein n=1 Tax=Candidatus Nitrospira nitrificans TaxID=1742973 RepID=A0A0S4LP14_9BACT|nr:hypothetical protein COMA2_50103 [Candidatus Nitrospira nitrificans]
MVTPRRQKKRPCFAHEAGSLFYQDSALLTLLRVLLFEPLHAPFGIDDLLRAREERMAIGTNIDADLTDGGTCLERISAGAVNRCLTVDRMNTLLHDLQLLTQEWLTRVVSSLPKGQYFNRRKIKKQAPHYRFIDCRNS